MANILSIIAAEGFQDLEYNDSKEALEEAGHTVTTASTGPEAHGKLGSTVVPDIQLNDVNPEIYDAVAFIGGPGSTQYFNDPKAHEIAINFYEAGKITAAICAAPSILANAGILGDKTVTSFESEAQNLKDHGANYTGEPVEIDDNIITANGPDAAEAFGQKIAESLGQSTT